MNEDVGRFENEGGRVVEGEVTDKTVEADAAPTEDKKHTPRDVALKAFQAEWTEKHGAALADFFLVTRALEDVQRQIVSHLKNPPDNRIARIFLAASASDALARVEADIMVAVGILLGHTSDEEVTAFLELAREHHEGFFALVNRFNADGSPVEAANDVGADEARPDTIILPDRG